MFVKSFKVLVGCTLLVLAAIVAYAALELSGPDDALDRAAAMLGRREFAAAISELNQVSSAVRNDPARGERLLRLRLRAYGEQGNHKGALLDVEELLNRGVAEAEPLQLERIRLRAASGDGPGALLAAEEFLADRPNHGRALELAGEACQTTYGPLLRDLNERLARDLPATLREAASTALWSFVYRPDADPELLAARAALASHYASDARLVTAWPAFDADLTQLRARVQTGLGYFQRSLAEPGRRPAAFRVVALALDQSGRSDDLLVACEIQRRRGEHSYLDEAGASAAWALVRDEAFAAALATCDRWLPPGTMKARVDAGTAGVPGTLDLLLARGHAAWRTNDKNLVLRAAQESDQLYNSKIPVPAAVWLTTAYQRLQAQNHAGAEPLLRGAVEQLARTPLGRDRVDILPEAAALWLDALQRRNAEEADVQAALQTWERARPASLEPLLARADIQQRRGRAVAAMDVLDRATTQFADDERLFAQRLQLARTHGRALGHDGEALLAQCLGRRSDLPDVRDPLGYQLCGEAAFQARQWTIAAACARAASDAMPRARPPRLLEIRVSVAEGRHADAARQCDRLLELLPPDAETLQLALTAHRTLGTERPGVLALAMAAVEPSAWLQAELLRASLARRHGDQLAFASGPARAAGADVPLRVLVATAEARSGSLAAAADLLDRALAATEEPFAANADAHRAFAEWTAAAAKVKKDAELVPLVARFLAQLHERGALDAAELWSLAERLAKEHPATAGALANAALASAEPGTRSGATWALAGALSLRSGAWQRTEEQWLAALAFADGRAPAESLMRLCLASDRPDRAGQIAPLVDTPTDATLAARLGSLATATTLLARDLLADPADLLTHAALALFGQPTMADWTTVDDDARAERLTLLSLLREPALAPFAQPRIQALLATEPKSKTNWLLMARVLAAGGNGVAAARIHAELFLGGAANPVFWREVAVTAESAGYELAPNMQLALLDAIASAGVGDSPLTIAFANRMVEQSFRRAGHVAEADQVRAARWAMTPKSQPMTADDLGFIAATLQPEVAAMVIDEALRGPTPPPRHQAITALFSAARRMIAADPARRPQALAAAMRYLATDGALGPIVHLLLALPADVTATAADLPPRGRLLNAHLAAVAAGTDDDAWLPQTLAALVAADGALATAEAIRDLLQQHPTALPLWLARTRLLLGTAAARTAVNELRAVGRHTDRNDLHLEVILCAAETGVVTPGDAAVFAKLPAALRQSELGRYTGALLALRAGQPDKALAALAALPKDFVRDGGQHLFFRAMALLQSKTAQPQAEAAQLFEQLARDYPSSSSARNAGSFARQLAPR